MLHRDKAVEHSMEKVRRSPVSGWEELTHLQRTRLRLVLEEIWENCDRERWQKYCFSTLRKADLLRLIAIGDGLREQHRGICDAREELDTILTACSTDGPGHQ